MTKQLVLAISSRALFDLQSSHKIYTENGVEAYAKHQISEENTLLQPGDAFNLVKKFLQLNQYGNFVEIVLLSRNSADTSLRIFNSIAHYGLDITRAAFTSGSSPYRYIKAFKADLFLSADKKDVQEALQLGYASAQILSKNKNTPTQKLHIAFDGDAVLFSDESEKIYQKKGIEEFTSHEQHHAKKTLSPGPFKPFLSALQNIQKHFKLKDCPIRTALITARSAPAHERVIRSLRDWNIRVDESLFLGGYTKRAFLQAFQTDIFFDDQLQHCESAKDSVSTAHVPLGIMNHAETFSTETGTKK